MDYLSAQSRLLRGLFSGASALDLINTTINSSPKTSPLRQWFSPTHPIPHSLLSSPSHPVIFLPVPDPASFQLLVHWMYFGCTASIENALISSTVTWEGLARNVEYLDMPNEIRSLLDDWRINWRKDKSSRVATDANQDSASGESESESDQLFSSVSTSMMIDAEVDADVEDETDSKEGARRRRKARRRSHQQSRKRQIPPSSPVPDISHSPTASQPPRTASR
jgi:hypothetical protein